MAHVPRKLDNPDDGTIWLHGVTREEAEAELGGPVIEVVARRTAIPEDFRPDYPSWWEEEHRPEFQDRGEKFWRLPNNAEEHDRAYAGRRD